MSRDISFFKINKIDQKFPDIVDVDAKDFTYQYAKTDIAREWQKQVGIRHKIRYQTVDKGSGAFS